MWEEATQEFLTSAEFDTNEVTQCSAFGRAALCMFMGSKIMEAKGFIEEKLQVHTDGEAAYRLFKTLTDIAGKEEDRLSFVIYAERALEIKPSDHELRFQTAYKYSEIGCQSLSLYHYRILEAHSFDGACLNNLGVVLTELALPCKSVSSYKKSAGLKETLAMANLGYKYLQAGFVDEALERVSDALKLAGEVDVHGNVGQMKIAVGEAVDKEGKQEETLIREAEKARAFRLRFVKSLCTRPKKPLDLDGKWHWGDWETMVLKCVDGKILGSFEKRLSVNRGLLSFLPLPLGTQPQTLPPEKYKTQKAVIRGVAQNLTATIEIKVTEEEEGVLFPFSKSVLEAKAMVIFDPEGQKAELQQENSPGKISYYDAIKLVSSIEQILNDPQRM
jgi:hypothetical protein